jgi:ribosomal silencing factor RsfS
MSTYLFTSLAIFPLGNLEAVGIAALSGDANIILKAVADSASADLSVLEVTMQCKAGDALVSVCMSNKREKSRGVLHVQCAVEGRGIISQWHWR